MLKRNLGRFVVLAVVFALMMSVSGVCFADSISDRTPMQVVDSHIKLMTSFNPELIASDYAEDCVVMMSMGADPVVGREGVCAWLTKIMPASISSIVGKIKIGDMTSMMNFTRKQECGNTVLLMFQMNPIMHGTETYSVSNGLIDSETSVMYLGSGRPLSF